MNLQQRAFRLQVVARPNRTWAADVDTVHRKYAAVSSLSASAAVCSPDATLQTCHCLADTRTCQLSVRSVMTRHAMWLLHQNQEAFGHAWKLAWRLVTCACPSRGRDLQLHCVRGWSDAANRGSCGKQQLVMSLSSCRGALPDLIIAVCIHHANEVSHTTTQEADMHSGTTAWAAGPLSSSASVRSRVCAPTQVQAHAGGVERPAAGCAVAAAMRTVAPAA